MSGQQAQLQPPISRPTNISYDLQFYAPLLKCAPANTTIQSRLVAMLEDEYVKAHINPGGGGVDIDNQTFHWELPGSEGDIAYFGAMLLNDSFMGVVPWWDSSQTLYLAKPWTLLGQIWIALPSAATETNDTGPNHMAFIQCQLYNASLAANVNFTNHVSSITVIENKWVNDIRWHDETLSYYLYMSYFMEIGSYLLGSLSWLNNTDSKPPTTQTIDNMNLLDTYLATSAQIYYMNKKITDWSGINRHISPSNLVRNISLVKDIEDFALNSTLSMLGEASLW